MQAFVERPASRATLPRVREPPMSARTALTGAAAALALLLASLPASAGHAAHRSDGYERAAGLARPGHRVRHRAAFRAAVFRSAWLAALPCCEFTTVAGATPQAPLYNRPLCD